MGSAPRFRKSLTSSIRPHRHAHPSGVLSSTVSRKSRRAPASSTIVASVSRSSADKPTACRRNLMKERRVPRARHVRMGTAEHQPEIFRASRRVHSVLEEPIPAAIIGRPAESARAPVARSPATRCPSRPTADPPRLWIRAPRSQRAFARPRPLRAGARPARPGRDLATNVGVCRAPVCFEQRDHCRVTPHLRLVQSRAGRVHVRVGIRTVRQQDLRQRHAPADRALAQRTAPRRNDVVHAVKDA